MNKFSKKVFNSTTNPERGEPEKKKEFERDTSDNLLFPEIQVKDISKLITEDTLGKLDGDTMVYQACANVETKSILVKHKTEDIEEELKGIREFKGLTKAISETSWLGVENIKREAKGLPLWTVEDFKVTPQAKLNYPYDKAIEQAKIKIHTKLKEMRLQFKLPRIDICLGEGDNFRNKLPTCKPYKGNRAEVARPIILKEIREWVLNDLQGELAVPREDGEHVECDDLVEYYGALGYQHYRKQGTFNYVVVAADKDSLGNPKLLCNPDKYTGEGNPKRGQFKQPQPMLIGATDKGCGAVELKVTGSKKEIKGYGLKWIIYQAILGEDTADHYSAIKHLGRKFDYGQLSAYKDLLDVKTPKDVIQKAVDVMFELLPYGVQYTTHDGVDMDVSTLEYMNTYFAVAYMLRSPKDSMTFTKLCDAFKVDISRVKDNNKLSAPELTFNKETAEESLDELKSICYDMLPDLKGFKTSKKGDLVELIEGIKEKHEKVMKEFDNFYHMVQHNKDTEEQIEVVQPLPDLREFMLDYCKKEGYDLSEDGNNDELFIECITEADKVWEDGYLDQHRWYALQDVVVELGGYYIRYEDVIITGDACMSDMDMEYKLDDFFMVNKTKEVKEVLVYK